MKRTAPLLLACLVALGCDLAPKPKPAPLLTATPEAITLIQETQEICVKVARTGAERVRGAEDEQKRAREEALEAANHSGGLKPQDTPDLSASEILEKYLNDEAAPELAAVDRAAGLLRDLMPKVKDEAPPEIAQAIQSLLNSEEQVCARARNPQPSRLRYQESLDYAVHDYNNAEAKLQAVYTVTATDAQYATNKYNPLLDEARAGADRSTGSGMRQLSPEELKKQRKEWEATQAYQQEQQAQHDAAVVRWRQREEGKEPVLAKVGSAPSLAAKENLSPEQRAQSMQTWYAGYTGKAGPARAAFATYLSVRRGSPEKVTPACQDLLSATTALVDDPTALDPPDPAAAKLLHKAYTELQACAQACVSGLDAEAAFRLASYQGAISQATTALQGYGMAP
ncbi:MAG TPA: hypothetical protein VGP73_21825 [Thermoanaerobaculia bacterium]